MKTAVNKYRKTENGPAGPADKELNRLLERHPSLYNFQAEIDRILMNSGGFENRKAVLDILIEARLAELRKHLGILSDIVRGVMEETEENEK